MNTGQLAITSNGLINKHEIEEQMNKSKDESLKRTGVCTEQVNHPSHYNQGSFEVIDVIEDWSLGFNLGNVVKYVARADHKGNALQDLEKAMFYLKREIQLRCKAK